MEKLKRYYVALNKQDNNVVCVFNMSDKAARWRCWNWLNCHNWNKDKIINDNDGKEYTWIEACANTDQTLMDFTLDTWLGYTNFTDPDLRLCEIFMMEDE